MKEEVHEAVTKYLKEAMWARPKEIIEAIYPKFKNKITEDSLKREVFRVLKDSSKIIRNYHSPFYFLKRPRKRFSDYEIEFIKKFFDAVEHPHRYFNTELTNIKQYPRIPLEQTHGFKKLRFILRRLWEDPRDIKIIDASGTRERINKLRATKEQDS